MMKFFLKTQNSAIPTEFKQKNRNFSKKATDKKITITQKNLTYENRHNIKFIDNIAITTTPHLYSVQLVLLGEHYSGRIKQSNVLVEHHLLDLSTSCLIINVVNGDNKRIETRNNKTNV